MTFPPSSVKVMHVLNTDHGAHASLTSAFSSPFCQGRSHVEYKQQAFPTDLCSFLCPVKVVHVLNMGTARVHSFQLSADESVNSLQKHVETETGMAAVNQEILLKVGLTLDPRKPATQCLTEGQVSERKIMSPNRMQCD